MVSFAVLPLNRLRFVDGEVVDLRLLFAGRHLTVTVRDASGAPVRDASVKAVADWAFPDHRVSDIDAARYTSRAGRTDDAGRIVLSGVSTRAQWVVVHAKGFAHKALHVSAGTGPAEANVFLVPEVVVKGQAKGLSRFPRGAWWVVAYCAPKGRAFAFVSSDGTYEIDGLPAGPLFLHLERLGRRQVVDSLITHAKMGETVRWDPVVKTFPTIRGHVVDLGSEPLAGWTVVAIDAQGSRVAVKTDDRGAFRLEVPKEGLYDVSVYPLNGHIAMARMTRVESGTDRLRIVCDATFGVLAIPVDTNGANNLGFMTVCVIPVKMDSATAPVQARKYAVVGSPGNPGEARTSRLPLGTYDAFLVVQGHGVFPLGERTLSSPGVQRDDPCSLPGLGRLTVLGTEGKAQRLSIVAMSPGQGAQRVIWKQSFDTDKPLALLPGVYFIVDPHGSSHREVRVEIRSGEAQVVRIN